MTSDINNQGTFHTSHKRMVKLFVLTDNLRGPMGPEILIKQIS